MKHASKRPVAASIGLSVSSAPVDGRMKTSGPLKTPRSGTHQFHAPPPCRSPNTVANPPSPLAWKPYSAAIDRRSACCAVAPRCFQKNSADSGTVTDSGPARGQDAQGADALDGSKLTFEQAIANAERAGGGPALEANSAGHGNNAYVDVDVIQDHGST